MEQKENRMLKYSKDLSGKIEETDLVGVDDERIGDETGFKLNICSKSRYIEFLCESSSEITIYADGLRDAKTLEQFLRNIADELGSKIAKLEKQKEQKNNKK